MQPIPTRENLAPVIDALAKGLAKYTDVRLDQAMKETVLNGVLSDQYGQYRMRHPSASVADMWVIWGRDEGPSVVIFSDKPEYEVSQWITSLMVSAWYDTVGETRRHPLARKAVKALCDLFEQRGLDPVPDWHRTVMVNAMITTHMVHIPLSRDGQGQYSMMLINVEGMPTAMIYAPNKYVENWSNAAQDVINRAIAGLW